MIKFFSSYNPPPSKSHEPCPMTQIDYIRDTQSGELVECGKIPFYERIQSYADTTTLSAKLRRFSLGDSSALGSGGGSYGDFTEMPSDLRSVLDARQKVLEDFNRLDPNIRGVFDNDFDKFEESVRNGTAERRIVEYNKSRASSSTQSGTSGAGSALEGGAQ